MAGQAWGELCASLRGRQEAYNIQLERRRDETALKLRMLTGSKELAEVWEDFDADGTLYAVVADRSADKVGFAIGRNARTPDTEFYDHTTFATRQAYWGAALAASLREALGDGWAKGLPKSLASHLSVHDQEAAWDHRDIARDLLRDEGDKSPMLLGIMRAFLPWGEVVAPLLLWQHRDRLEAPCPVPEGLFVGQDIRRPCLITGNLNLHSICKQLGSEGRLVAATIREPERPNIIHTGFGLGPRSGDHGARTAAITAAVLLSCGPPRL